MKKQHKEGTCKVSGRSVVFSAFYADFCLCPKLVIIATLICILNFGCCAKQITTFTVHLHADKAVFDNQKSYSQK